MVLVKTSDVLPQLHELLLTSAAVIISSYFQITIKPGVVYQFTYVANHFCELSRGKTD